jgi:hypothetical protein
LDFDHAAPVKPILGCMHHLSAKPAAAIGGTAAPTVMV